MRRVLIIGGGASGVLFALHFLRGRDDAKAVLIERSAELGAGAAYATNHPDHVLNVRAANMSAFPDDPLHFVRWLSERSDAAPKIQPTDFVPRHRYRDYLASQLAPHLADGSLVQVRVEAVGLAEDDAGVAVTFADGGQARGDAAVLATGNEGPDLPPAPWRHDGWSNAAAQSTPPDEAIVVVGTGLTMVDRVLAMLHAGHRGSITAVSRRGLPPHSHRIVAPTALPRESVPFDASLVDLTAWTRRRVREAQASGGDWRAIVDGLRPHTQDLWGRLSLVDRRRFLRHLRPFWDCHRHRIAPDAARRIEASRASGQLRVLAAQVERFETVGRSVDVHLLLRRSGGREKIRAAAVLECRGRALDVRATRNPVLRDLLGSGLARPDPLSLGLDVTADDALIGADGRPSRRIHALGPLTSGVYWEVVAVPDIRVQAARLAAVVTRTE